MLIVLLVMPVLTLAIYASHGLGFPLWWEFIGLIDLSSLLLYAPYFVFGSILTSRGELLSRFSSINPLWLVGMLLLATMAQDRVPGLEGLIGRVADVYLETPVSWLSVALCFYLFYRLFNQASATWRLLSDAAYTVYLFHHLVVIAYGMLPIKLGVEPIPGMLILMLTVTLTTLLIHRYCILPSRTLRFLFNGK